MKRSALMMAVAVCLLIFSGCGGTVDITPIREAVANAPEQAHGSFTANIRFGDELATLLFSMGSFDAVGENRVLAIHFVLSRNIDIRNGIDIVAEQRKQRVAVGIFAFYGVKPVG